MSTFHKGGASSGAKAIENIIVWMLRVPSEDWMSVPSPTPDSATVLHDLLVLDIGDKSKFMNNLAFCILIWTILQPLMFPTRTNFSGPRQWVA